MKFLLKLSVFIGFCVSAAAQSPAARAVEVVVSIKPIHSLVAGVMGETGKPRLLLRGSASPHIYQMRPSEAQALSEAALIVWIGESMETFLARPVGNLGSGATVVTLHEAPGLRLLRNREAGLWEEDHGKPHVDEQEGHGHDHDEFDMHLWLDPGNALRIVEVVAESLARVDPSRAGTYRDNAEAMKKRIAALESSLRRRLAPVRDRGFIVFHDAYQYFTRAFALDGKGAVAVDPGRPPGAKRLAGLRASLAEHRIRCVFTEPQFEPDLVRVLIAGTNVRTAALDPLGAGIEPGPDAWFGIMNGLGSAMVGCLQGN